MINYCKRALYLGLFPVILVACSTPPAEDPRTSNLINSTLDESILSNQKYLPITVTPESISQALLPKIQLDLPEQTGIDVEPRFDIKVNQTKAREFFIGLVEATAYNIVVHPKVSGRISLDLKNVSILEVMDIVRDVYGFDYESTPTALRVYPDAIRTKIFKLDYLAIKRSGSSNVRVSSGQVSQINNGDSGGSSLSSNSNNSSGSSSRNRETVAASRIDTTTDSDFWQELKLSLMAMIGSKNGRKVVISPHSGVIVVRAMPDELRIVDRYLKTTQKIVHRQVLLEARVIEVVLSDGFQSGINWAALKQTPNSSVLIGQTGGGTLFDNGTSLIDGNTGDLNPAALSQVVGTATSAFGGIFTAAFNIKGNFAAFIELLETQGDVQVLSSPQVSTLNNQKAVIKVGRDNFFITDVETTSTSTATTTSNTGNNVELTSFFSGVALDVIPQISDDNSITLHIHPTVVDVTEEVKNISVSADTVISVPLAVSSIRESDSIIRAQNGQVVIIGGLMTNKTIQNESSVPFLGDIPLIGALFKHKRETTVKSELVILLKPTIIESSQQWVQGLKRVQRNIQSITHRPILGE